MGLESNIGLYRACFEGMEWDHHTYYSYGLADWRGIRS